MGAFTNPKLFSLSQLRDEGFVCCLILEMLRRFAKLLNKYARLLNYEDAYNDLMVFFLESLLSDNMKKLIGKPDAVIVHYIAKTIKNEYIC